MNTSITQQNFYVFKQEKSYCSTEGMKEKAQSRALIWACDAKDPCFCSFEG